MISGSLLVMAAPGTTSMAAATAPGNREQCLQWQGSRGPERAALANALGQRNGLTKRRKFATAVPGDPHSLYSPSDIQRLCRDR